MATFSLSISVTQPFRWIGDVDDIEVEEISDTDFKQVVRYDPGFGDPIESVGVAFYRDEQGTIPVDLDTEDITDDEREVIEHTSVVVYEDRNEVEIVLDLQQTERDGGLDIMGMTQVLYTKLVTTTSGES